jgi:hypothetical protein
MGPCYKTEDDAVAVDTKNTEIIPLKHKESM